MKNKNKVVKTQTTHKMTSLSKSLSIAFATSALLFGANAHAETPPTSPILGLTGVEHTDETRTKVIVGNGNLSETIPIFDNNGIVVGSETIHFKIANTALITNLTDGEVSEVSTDAINGSQLYNALKNIGLKFSDDKKIVLKRNGDTVTIVGDNANIEAVLDDEGKFTLSLKPNITVNSVVSNQFSTTNNKVNISDDSVTFGGNTLNNVGAGVINNGSTDAVNGNQVYNVSNSIAKIVGGTATVGTDGTVNVDTHNVFGIGLTGKHTIDEAIAHLAKGGFSIAENGSSDPAHSNLIHRGSHIDFINGKNTTASVEVIDDNRIYTNVTYHLNDDIAINSLRTNDNRISLSSQNGLNVGHTVIQNVGNGEISISSTDAVNGSQVFNLDKLNVKYDDENKNIITLNKDGNSFTKITNLQGGSLSDASNDAVSGSQINNKMSHIAINVIGGNAVADPENANIITSDIGGTGENTIDGAIAFLNKRKTDIDLGVLKNNADESKLANNGKISFNDGVNTTVSKSVDEQGTINIAYNVNKDIVVDSVTTTGGNVSISDIGVSVGGTVIKKVGDGEISATSTDAINGKQLYEAGALNVKYDDPSKNSVTLKSNVGYSVALKNVKAGQVHENSTDAINGSQLYSSLYHVVNSIGKSAAMSGDFENISNSAITINDLGGTGKNTIHDAIEYLNNKKVDISLGVLANNENESKLVNESKISFDDGVNTTVSKSVDNAGTVHIAYNVNKDITVDSVTTTGGKVSISDIGVSVGGTVIKNVGDGEISATSTDAINGKQLYEAGALNVKYDSAAKDTITLNAGGSPTKITNAQNGSLSTTSTDVVNGSQINASLTNVAVDIIGGNAAVNAENGKVTTSNVGGTGQNTIDGAIAYLNNKKLDIDLGILTNGTDESTLKNNGKVNFNNGKNTNVTKSVDEKGTINIAYNVDKDITVDSVTTTGGKVSISDTGISVGGTVIKNVGKGNISDTSAEAVNGSQIYHVTNVLANNVVGGNAKVDGNGAISISNVGGTGKNNINDAIEYLNNKDHSHSFTISDNTGVKSAVEKNRNVQFESGNKNLNVSVSAVDNDGRIDHVVTTTLADDIELNSVTVGNNKVTLNNNGLDVKGGEINGLKTINNIEDAANNNKAVNVETLRNSLKDKLVEQNPENREITIGAKTDGNRITVNNAAGEVRNIGGVANAIHDHDAVNYSQLKDLGNKVNQQIGEVDDNARAGIAGAVATGSLPQVFEYGRNMAAVAVGHYRGKQAVAVGFSAATDNGKHLVKINGSISANDGKNATIGAGYGYMW